MIRQKVVLGKYTYMAEYYFADEDLVNNPHREEFYVIKNQDIMSNITIDKDIYIISKKIFDRKNIVYPITYLDGFGYSLSLNDFNKNLHDIDFVEEGNVKNYNVYKFYDSKNEPSELLCDKLRIYFPVINNELDAIIDINNMINDIKIHYFVDDVNNYERYSETEFTEDHNSYSEFIEIYLPSIHELIYNNGIFIKDYNNNFKEDSNGNVVQINENEFRFNTLLYPFKINEERNEDGKILSSKTYLIDKKYLSNHLFSVFNMILYPYTDIDVENKFIVDTTYSLTSFNIDLSFSLIGEVRFPYFEEIKDETYYGVPALIAKFKYPKSNQVSLLESYLEYNGYSDINEFYDEDVDDKSDMFEDKYEDIKRTGFYIEISSDRLFRTSFFKYAINIKEDENIIDDLVFPLNEIFFSWDDIPPFICARVTYVDKVSDIEITSNPIIINNEWYKYLVNEKFRNKLKLDNLYNININEGNMTFDYENVVFIDKINCNIVKSSDDKNTGIVYKNSNTPKVIYKPIFFRTSELNTVNIKADVKQNIGINLGEYMSKVETFKLIIGENEYIEYGRNDIFVIFNINAKNITGNSGRYIILNEEDDFISDGSWILS